MAETPTQLPVYIQARFDENGTFTALESGTKNVVEVMRTNFRSAFGDMSKMADAAQRDFDTAFRAMETSLSNALSKPRAGASGALDLGLGDLRKQQAAAEAAAAAALELANATRTAAQAEGDFSERARTAIAAADALAVEKRAAAAAARDQADAAEQVQQVLNRQASATNLVTGGTKRLAGANDNLRFATMGATQQVQDIAISLYGGQRASTVFAQQLPQLAFALSALEGNANKTADRIGKFATFMSGPWGLAIGLGVGVLGTLIANMVETGDEADKAKKKTFDFSDGLKVLTLSAKDSADAMAQLSDEMRSAIAVQGNFLRQKAQIADQSVTDLQGRINTNQSQLSYLQKYEHPYTLNALLGIDEISNKANQLRAQIAADQEALKSAQAAALSADIAVSQGKVLEDLDAATAATGRYERAVGDLNKRLGESRKDPVGASTKGIFITQEQYDAEFKRLTALKNAEVEAAREAGKANQQFGREIDLAGAKSIAQSAGFKVTSDYRTKAEQQWLYDNRRTAENPVALPGTSAHEKGNALDIAFGSGVSVEAIRKAYAEEGVKLTKILKETGHFHIEWSTTGVDKAQREAKQIADFSNQAAESVARVTSRFDAAPKIIDEAAQATRRLDDVITGINAKLAEGGIGKKMADGLRKTREEAEAAKQVIQEALVRPIEDARKASQQRLAVQELLAQGRDDEATGLQAIFQLEQQLGDEEMLRAKLAALTAAGRKDEAAALQSLLDKYPEMKRQAAEGAEVEARKTRELERQKALFDAQLDVLNQAKTSLTGLLSGRKTDLLGDLKSAFKDLQGKQLFDGIFGNAFAGIEDQLRQRTPLGKATGRLETNVNMAAASVGNLANAVDAATAKILGAVNDNVAASAIDGNEITVTGRRPSAADATSAKTLEMRLKNAQELADKTAHGMVDPLLQGFDEILGTKFFMNLSGTLAGALGGYLTGDATGGILGGLKGLVSDTGIFGGKDGALAGKLGAAETGAQIGKISSGIMKSLGISTSTTGAEIGGAIGSFIPIPGGDIIGAIAGGILGGLFKKKPYGTAALTSATQDATITGNKGSARDAAGTLAGSVQQGLVNIADQLGAQLGNFAVSIGTYKDNYRVSTQGGSAKLGGHSGTAAQNEKQYGLYDFGKDSEAAIKFAISDAIKDGALLGLRKSTAALLQAGKDLDAQTQKAVTWENAFKELKSYTDPVGAALDTLDQQFKNLISISKEAGASQEELAQLEQLYGIKRTEIVKAQSEQIVGSLKSLYSDLTTGDNGLSLRDRRAAALTTYDSLASKVAAGDKTAYGDYADAAKSLLGIERDLYGSQQQYFDRLNQITDLTKTRIDAETNVVSIAANRDSPFDATGAVNTSITTQTDVLGAKLDAMIQNQATALSLAYANGTGGVTASQFAFNSTF